MANITNIPKSPVAKHINTFNKPATHEDKKELEKGGYEKHRPTKQKLEHNNLYWR